MQLTFDSPWPDRSKLEWRPWGHSRHWASTSFAPALDGLKILLGSALSACSLPARWQFSHVTPFFPCIWAILVCGLDAKPLATSSWHVAHISEPANSDAAGSVDPAAGFAPGLGAAMAMAQNKSAPRMNIKQVRSGDRTRPSAFPAASTSDRQVCMKDGLLPFVCAATLGGGRVRRRDFLSAEAREEVFLVPNITSCGESYVLSSTKTVMSITTRIGVCLDRLRHSSEPA